MNPKLLFLVWTCLLTLSVDSNAQQTFKINGKEPAWTYHNIAELHSRAKTHLVELDAQIADKKEASESLLNPFKERALARYNELVEERKVFLDQTWTCPHWFWRTCGGCDGKGTRWAGWRTCRDCNGSKGHNLHGNHPEVDVHHSCDPSTIRALLKVTD